MGRDAIQQFRIITWPGSQLPHPGQLQRLRQIADDLICPVSTAAGNVSPELRRLSLSDAEQASLRERLERLQRRLGLRDRWDVIEAGEIYLELEGLDLNDEDEILVFVNRFSPLGISSEDYAAVRDLPWYAGAVEALRQGAPAAGTAINPFSGGTRPVTTMESLVEFRFAAKVLRDLRAAYVALREGKPEAMSWQSVAAALGAGSNLFEPAPGVYEISPKPDPMRLLARFLELTLTAALSPVHPRLSLTAPERRPEHGWMSGATVSLYATCSLELYNHIAEEATYRRCENPSCGRIFVRQKGRAQAGQYRRKGIKYCSNYCARAAAQRSYRERHRKLDRQ